MRTLLEMPGTYALLGTCALLGSASVEAQPVRPTVPHPSVFTRRSIGENAASPEARRFVEAFLCVEQQWRETEQLLVQRQPKGDFIFDMVAPESLALAPAIAEYEVDYSLEWDEEPYPMLDVDDVDLEIIDL